MSSWGASAWGDDDGEGGNKECGAADFDVEALAVWYVGLGDELARCAPSAVASDRCFCEETLFNIDLVLRLKIDSRGGATGSVLRKEPRLPYGL